MYLLDMGEKLGKTITSYRRNYFNPGQTNGHIVYNYKLKGDSQEAIYRQIEICISMKAKDYLNLPERINREVEVLNSDIKSLKRKWFLNSWMKKKYQ